MFYMNTFGDLDTGLLEPVAPANLRTIWKDIMHTPDAGSYSSMMLTRSICMHLAAVAWSPDYSTSAVSSDNEAEGEVLVLIKA